MNYEKFKDMRIGEFLELKSLFEGGTSVPQQVLKTESNMLQEYVGKYVIVRTRNEGVNAGYIKALDDTGIALTEVRRLYYHKPLDTNMSWYEGVATSGCSDDTKLSNPVSEKVLVEDYSITLCTKEAEEVIKNAKTNKQN